MTAKPTPERAVKAYLDRLERDLKAGNATEHTHRAALATLIEALLPDVHTVNEPKRGKYGAPDYLMKRKEVTVGYAEAKDVGVNLADTEDSEQLRRYRAALPNLLLTDYLSFRWYVEGQKREEGAVLGEWKGGKLTRQADGAGELSTLLERFGQQQPVPVVSAQDLARRMALLTRLIHDVVGEMFRTGEASDTLKSLLKAFRETVLPALTEAEFADMYAQTLAYGLFAARVNHQGMTFTRMDAARSIPKTNPLLQKLFYTLTGPELDDEPYVTLVDDLAALLSQADLEQVLAEFGTADRQEDPIVHFYETFLTKYNPELRVERGVYYTPTPVVSYIVRSVDSLLVRDFGLTDGLGNEEKVTFKVTGNGNKKEEIRTPRLLIMDPATGTGTFPFQIIRLLRQRFSAGENAGQWPAFVREHLIHALYGFEVMMAPYAVAHLKLSMELAGLDMPDDTDEEQELREEQGVQLDQRLNIYLTNTVEDPRHDVKPLPGQFKAISDEAQQAGVIKAEYPIMVVLGNPPYSGRSANNGEWIDDLLKGNVRIKGKIDISRRTAGNYYEVDGQPLGERNTKWLQDDYVKFIRWAQWRVEQTGAGVVAFITPHGYLDNPTFRGMRKSLMRTFDDIYVLDLHGNANKKEKTPDGGFDQNVFDIRTGVAIGIFVRKNGVPGARAAQVHRADLWGDRDTKYEWLGEHDVTNGGYTTLTPLAPGYLWLDRDAEVDAEYSVFTSITEIFPVRTPGFMTGNDRALIHFDQSDAIKLAKQHGALADVRQVAYRPFDDRWTIYNEALLERSRRNVFNHLDQANLALLTSRMTKGENFAHVMVSSLINETIYLSNKTSNNAFSFPLYLYPPADKGAAPDAKQPLLLGGQEGDVGDAFPVDALGRMPNLSKSFITKLSAATGLTFAPGGATHTNEYAPEDVFHYIYAVLHSPAYRLRYVDFLRSDFPRLPLPDTAARFQSLASLGEKLAAQHLMNGTKRLGGFPKKGDNKIASGYPKFKEPEMAGGLGKIEISEGQWFSGIPKEVWAFRVGGYQVAEKWLKDRRGRTLTLSEQRHYQLTLGAIKATLDFMEQVDDALAGLLPVDEVPSEEGEIPQADSREPVEI